ncbi:MAG: hypothetical protein ACFFA6_04710 [Promethearchaeota archaeon]
MSVKEEILSKVLIPENLNENKESLKDQRKYVRQKQVYKGYRLKPKLVFTFVMYLLLILTFMIIPLIITLLIT